MHKVFKLTNSIDKWFQKTNSLHVLYQKQIKVNVFFFHVGIQAYQEVHAAWFISKHDVYI